MRKKMLTQVFLQIKNSRMELIHSPLTFQSILSKFKDYVTLAINQNVLFFVQEYAVDHTIKNVIKKY